MTLETWGCTTRIQQVYLRHLYQVEARNLMV
jgi:hypothetical protein